MFHPLLVVNKQDVLSVHCDDLQLQDPDAAQALNHEVSVVVCFVV